MPNELPELFLCHDGLFLAVLIGPLVALLPPLPTAVHVLVDGRLEVNEALRNTLHEQRLRVLLLHVWLVDHCAVGGGLGESE